MLQAVITCLFGVDLQMQMMLLLKYASRFGIMHIAIAWGCLSYLSMLMVNLQFVHYS